MTRRALITVIAAAALLVSAATAAASYQFRSSTGGAGTLPGQFTNPGLMAVGPDGSVWVADTGNSRVDKFDGTTVTFVQSFTDTGSGAFSGPAAVAVSPTDGSVYVTDTGNNRVVKLNADGTPSGLVWGTTGSGSGQFNSPQGIAVSPDGGTIYVADQGNHRIEVFASSGAPTGQADITSAVGGFTTLRGLAVAPDTGNIYAVDAGNDRIEEFSAAGAPVTQWGSSAQFAAPAGIAVSAAGVYVADTNNNRVSKFTADGAAVDQLDASAGDPSFAAPVGVAVSSAQSTAGLIYTLGNSQLDSYSETSSTNLPPPTTGETANAQPVNGTVKVKKPGSNQFQVLAAGAQIPIGSVIDVTKGTIDLTTTATTTTTQTARFYSGVFKLTQDKSASPTTELQLFGGNFKKSCPVSKPRRASVSAKKKVVRQLWGVGKGKFRTKGRFASATVRGTQWLTQDRCDGTKVTVADGSVLVRDLVKRKNVIVNAPNSYLAAAKKPAKKP